MTLRSFFVGALAVLSLSTAAASDDNPAFRGTVIVRDDGAVQVEAEDGVRYDLVDGDVLLADGGILDGEILWVERVVKNPRTVVALEDTHF